MDLSLYRPNPTTTNPSATGVAKSGFSFLFRLSFALLLGGFAAAAGGDEPIETPAYREMVRADQLRDAGRTQRALAPYQEAVRLFEALREDFPNYKPATIEYRLAYCRNQIRRLESGSPALASEGLHPPSALEAEPEEAGAETRRWQAEAERLSLRVLELETSLMPPGDRLLTERISALEVELSEARQHIRELEARGEQSRTAAPGPRYPEPAEPAIPPPGLPARTPERAASDDPLQEAQQALSGGDVFRARRLFEAFLEADQETVRRGFLPWRRRIVGGNPQARFGLVQALTGIRELHAARRLLSGLVREDPENADYARQEGVIARTRGNTASAVRFFSRAVERAPDRPDYLFDLATALHTQGAYEEAFYRYRAVLALDPEHRLAHYNLAVLLADEGPDALDAAEAHYRNALALGEPRDPSLEQRLHQRGSRPAPRP